MSMGADAQKRVCGIFVVKDCDITVLLGIVLISLILSLSRSHGPFLTSGPNIRHRDEN